MSKKISTYEIQEWLFNEAEGRFKIDLAESGIQYHYFHDLDLLKNYDLNYSLDRGNVALRECIANIYDVDISNVIVTHGSQEALFLLYQCLLTHDDHVITFSPGWQQAWEVPKSIGAQVTIIELSPEKNYQIDVTTVEKLIQANTRLLILNSPNNPTGTVLSEECLIALQKLCHEKNIFIVNDEEYLTHYASSIIHLSKNAGSTSSLSKVYGFPGLRLGWFVGPKDLVEEMVNYKRYVTVTNSSICEQLALQILSKHHKYLDDYHVLIKERFPFVTRILSEFSSLKIINPQGTPYVYINTPQYDSWEFSRALLKEKEVLVMPAEVFSSKNAIRVSFAREANVLNSGLELLAEHVNQMEKIRKCKLT